jgi:hypothetical protein
MIRRICISVALLLMAVICTGAAQRGADASPADLSGVWTGTWEGGGTGSGGFELTLEKGKDGALGGRVSVTGEPTYKATLKTLSIEGKALSATYDFPPDESMEVVLAATIEGGTAKGTWSARQKGGGELASGTWTVTRK